MQEEEECCLIEKEERSNNRGETFYLWLFHILCFLFLASQRKLDCPSNMKLIMEYVAYLLNFILYSAVLPMLQKQSFMIVLAGKCNILYHSECAYQGNECKTVKGGKICEFMFLYCFFKWPKKSIHFIIYLQCYQNDHSFHIVQKSCKFLFYVIFQ